MGTVRLLDVTFVLPCSRVLEDGYLNGWINKQEPTCSVKYANRQYTADFALMKIFEDEVCASCTLVDPCCDIKMGARDVIFFCVQENVSGVVVDVVDAMTYILDQSASTVDGFYDGNLFLITHSADGGESRVSAFESCLIPAALRHCGSVSFAHHALA